MKIVDHLLCHDDGTPYPYRPSPNTNGKLDELYYLVMHYTAGPNAEQAVNWLINPAARASAHLVIGRDGSITQLVKFDAIAWHAGQSSWDGLNGLNKYSIGIELDNAGPLTRSGNQWRAWFSGGVYEDNQVIEAIHKNRSTSQGWLLYTPEQLYAALEVSALLVQHYQLRDILGHEDIAPRRKTDPGPAFPMDAFRSKLFGRSDESSDETIFENTITLNIRSGPGANFDNLQGGPLPQGTRLLVREIQGNWCFVEVLDDINGIMDLEGWVNARYLRKKTP